MWQAEADTELTLSASPTTAVGQKALFHGIFIRPANRKKAYEWMIYIHNTFLPKISLWIRRQLASCLMLSVRWAKRKAICTGKVAKVQHK